MRSISKTSLDRLAHYHYYLKQLDRKHRDFVSDERLAADLNLALPDVRKDLENLDPMLTISNIHQVKRLLEIIEACLGYNRSNRALIVGAGKLGKALLDYHGFKSCGLDIAAVFDQDKDIAGTYLGNTQVLPLERLEEMILRLQIHIGIITTPPEAAQSLTNRMIEAGITGIWNFSLAVLKVPAHITIQNSSLYGDFLKLKHKMEEKNEYQ
jgi:redox-sensing transcriptional repressor